MISVSVIVPIYNVEPYLERCVCSLLAQTLHGLELIFVNDASTDNSMQVLQRVLAGAVDCPHQIRIIQNEHNLGLSATRRVGFLAAEGEYLGTCDSDDWVEPEMYELLYQSAKQSNSDIAVCDLVIEYKDRSKPMLYNIDRDPHRCLQLSADQTCFPSSFVVNLIQRELVLKATEKVLPVSYSEDRFAMTYAYYYAHNISHVPQCLYHYNYCNPNSLTSQRTFPEGMWEGQRQNIDRIVALLDPAHHPENRLACQWLKYELKHLYRSAFPSLRSFYYEYRECHNDILYYQLYPMDVRRKRRIIYSCYPVFWLYNHTKGSSVK